MAVVRKGQIRFICMGIVGEYLSQDSVRLDEMYPITLE